MPRVLTSETPPLPEGSTWAIAAMYQFADLHDYDQQASNWFDLGVSLGLRGTAIVAPEGINGTVAGTARSVNAFLTELRKDTRLSGLEAKFATSEKPPFKQFKIKIKPEIVTFRQAGIDPRQRVGDYIEPRDWNAVISDPKTRLIDTRNTYETRIGTFKGAIDPQIEDFTAFAKYVDENLDPTRDKQVAMFCTGGIRCEKATAYLLERGFQRVMHLKGGILRYLEEVPPEESLWQGDCFVFDERVAVDHQLRPAPLEICEKCYGPKPLGHENLCTCEADRP